VWDEAEPGDHFGFSLAKVNWMPNSSQDDLAIGVYGEDFPNAQDAGAVHILAGDLDGGLKEYPQDLKRQSWPEQAGARFGYAVARSGYRSIAVGAPLADVGSVVDAGSVTITGGPEQVWTQDSTDVLDQAEFGDRFGAPLIALGIGGTYGILLAIGVSREDVEAATDAGAVAVLYADDFFSAADNQIWHQDSVGIAGKSETADRLGMSLV
jgi:hypothetical protein